MNETNEQFDDPALKSAIRRVWSGESAPEGLRAQVTAAMAGAGIADQATPHGRGGTNIWNRPLSPMAAAAIALFALLGAGVWIYYGAFAPDHIEGRRGPYTLSTDLISAMIAVHDQSSTKPATAMLVASTNDFSGLRKTLLTKLHRPVWVSDLSSAGWKFQGASIANIAGNDAAELIFTKGDQTLSLLSLRGPDACDGSPEDYEFAAQNHDVVGFAAGGTLFCIVESSRGASLSLSEVKKLRDEFRKDAMAALNFDVPGPVRTN